MLVYYFVPFIVSNRYLLFWVSNGNNSVTVQNRTHVYTNFFHHKDLGNHLLQLCPKVVKHPVFTRYRNWNTLHLQGTETETPCIYKVQKLKHPVFTRYRNWNTLYLQGTETETQPEEVSVLKPTGQNENHQPYCTRCSVRVLGGKSSQATHSMLHILPYCTRCSVTALGGKSSQATHSMMHILPNTLNILTSRSSLVSMGISYTGQFNMAPWKEMQGH